MSEWWTYRPSDLLMFSARSWERLLELHNRSTWPLHLLMALIGVGLLWTMWTRPRALRASAALGLAAVWLWVGWAFHWVRFSTLNTAAPVYAVAFWLQAILLVALAIRGPGAVRRFPRAGLALAAAGLLLWPLAALAGGHLAAAQFFGMAPDPTALVTLGFLLATDLRQRAWAAVVPLAWLAIGSTTAWLLR